MLTTTWGRLKRVVSVMPAAFKLINGPAFATAFIIISVNGKENIRNYTYYFRYGRIDCRCGKLRKLSYYSVQHKNDCCLWHPRSYFLFYWHWAFKNNERRIRVVNGALKEN